MIADTRKPVVAKESAGVCNFAMERMLGLCYEHDTARLGEAWRGPVERDAARHGKTWQGGGVMPKRASPSRPSSRRRSGRGKKLDKPFHRGRRALSLAPACGCTTQKARFTGAARFYNVYLSAGLLMALCGITELADQRHHGGEQRR